MYPRTSTFWTQAPAQQRFPPLRREIEADVVVIGAGITGMTAALRLAEAGKRVVVIEARTVCGGATGSTTAHVTEEVDPRYVQITKMFGVEGARLVAASVRGAIEHIAARVDRLGIACDFARVPGYLYTEDVDRRDGLADELAAARKAGLDVTLDAPLGLPFPVAGTVRFERQARFHPCAYVDGLLRAALEQGVQIFEHTRVVEISDGEPVEVHTESGVAVRAAAAFCATHVPLNRVALHTKLGHYQTYAVGFRGHPVEDALFWDDVEPYHYLRMARLNGQRYLIVGGEDHRVGAEAHTQFPFEHLLVYARARFATDRPDFHWSEQVIESIDGLPLIGPNAGARHVYVATGFSGTGMTYGTVAGLLVSELVLGLRTPFAALYDATRIKPSAAGAFLRESKEMPVHFLGDRLEAPDVRRAREIERDQGRTMKLGGKRLAVYRDPMGKLHAVSGVCTHLGCLVRFNEAERTWDCPCHGSRYTVDGAVIDGPARTPLAPFILEDGEPRAGDGTAHALPKAHEHPEDVSPHR